MIDQTSPESWLVHELDLVIPVYKNREMTERCLRSVVANLGEISAHSPRVIVVNDSPLDTETTAFLRRAKNAGDIHLLIENEENLGFVKSVNRALEESRDRGASAILINSDTVTFPGTLAEMVKVANVDEQFAFVCPRSNNASICTFPRPPHARAGTTDRPEECHATWQALKGYLPRYSYVPTAIGFYLLVKAVVIRNFGGLDERFGAGYEEENDLIMRAGKVGFRAVLANHAYAFHFGSASFSLTDIELDEHRLSNLKEMDAIHPEFLPLVKDYEQSAEWRSEPYLSSLLPDDKGRLDIAFILLSMGRHFNGTNEFIVNVLKAFCALPERRFNVTLICSRDVAQFHGLDELPGVRIREHIDQTYAIAFSFGQPYDLHILNVMENAGAINVFSMLDVISLDCSALRHSQKVEELWEAVAACANGVVAISQFSMRTFMHRFPENDAKLFSQLLPTKPEAYADRYRSASIGQRHVYVAGNHFPHKDSGRTGRYLATQFPSLAFLVLGSDGQYPANARVLASGSVEDDVMVQAIADASAVVLPSYYEGFGFTLMHALALGKPVVARDIPVTREILGTFSNPEGIFLFSDDIEMKAALEKAISAGSASVGESRGCDWNGYASRLEDFLVDLCAVRTSVHRKLVKRMKYLDLARKKHALAQIELAPAELKTVGSADIQRVSLSWPRLANSPPEAFVTELYEKLLGREPDAGGRLSHLEQLDAGAERTSILMGFMKSSEYRQGRRRVVIRGAPVMSSAKFWLAERGWL